MEPKNKIIKKTPNKKQPKQTHKKKTHQKKDPSSNFFQRQPTAGAVPLGYPKQWCAPSSVASPEKLRSPQHNPAGSRGHGKQQILCSALQYPGTGSRKRCHHETFIKMSWESPETFHLAKNLMDKHNTSSVRHLRTGLMEACE